MFKFMAKTTQLRLDIIRTQTNSHYAMVLPFTLYEKRSAMCPQNILEIAFSGDEIVPTLARK